MTDTAVQYAATAAIVVALIVRAPAIIRAVDHLLFGPPREGQP